MLDGKQQAELEQSIAAQIEMFPPLWRGVFLGCKKEGFTDEQSMELVKTMIMKDSMHGPNI